MKKSIIAILAISIAATAMARYAVYDVRFSGTGIDVKEGKATFIENGEKHTMDKYVRSSGSLMGYVVVDEWQEFDDFLFIEKDDYTQDWADMDWDLFETVSGSVVSGPDKLYKYSAKGIACLSVAVDLDDLYLRSVVIGNWSESEKEVVKGGETNWMEKFSFSATGAGRGEDYVDEGHENVDLFVKNAKVKYNSKLSDNMWNAWEGAGGWTNETDGVQAAADVINDLIRKKAPKLEKEPHFYLPGLDD